jgi:hypothetical protein
VTVRTVLLPAILCLLAAAPPAFLRAVDPPAEPGAMGPNLVRLGEGLALTWLEPLDPAERAKGHALRFSRFAGGSWSPPVTIASGAGFFANWADFPSLGVGPDGTLFAHWLEKTGPDTYAYAVELARSQDGGATWQTAGILHGDSVDAEHGFVSWVGDRAFWLDGREMPKGGAMALRTRVLSGPEQILDPRVCECCQTDAARTEAGAIVVYRDRSDDEVRDVYAVRETAAGWSAPARVAADGWKIPGCPVNGPAVAASGKKVAVAWFTGGEPRPRVQLTFSQDAGATFDKPLVIDESEPLGRVDVVLDETGDAWVAWIGQDPKASIHLRRASPDGKLGSPTIVAATSAERASGFPRMVRLGGELFVAWVEAGSPSRVHVTAVKLPAGRSASAF